MDYETTLKSQYEYLKSNEPGIIISQLTEILDFLDSCLDHKTPDYTILIAELSMCLKEKSNQNLLPYLYTLRRYRENELCGQMLLNIYYRTNVRKTRGIMIDK
jgi:hypothetical protein